MDDGETRCIVLRHPPPRSTSGQLSRLDSNVRARELQQLELQDIEDELQDVSVLSRPTASASHSGRLAALQIVLPVEPPEEEPDDFFATSSCSSDGRPAGNNSRTRQHLIINASPLLAPALPESSPVREPFASDADDQPVTVPATSSHSGGTPDAQAPERQGIRARGHLVTAGVPELSLAHEPLSSLAEGPETGLEETREDFVRPKLSAYLSGSSLVSRSPSIPMSPIGGMKGRGRNHRLNTKRMIEAELTHVKANGERVVTNLRMSGIPFQDIVLPEEPSRLQRFHELVLDLVQHKFFTLSVTMLVVLNALYIGVETASMTCSGETDGIGWYAADVCFTLCFNLELSLRFFAFRIMFFRDGWNILDCFLVLIAVVDNFVLEFILQDSTGGFNVLSVLRFLRLFRFIRVFRLIRFLKELWFLVEGIIASLSALAWAWFLLVVMMYIPAIFATQILGKGHTDDPQMSLLFGTLPRSMYTLFQVMSLDRWADIARTSGEVEPWSWAFFVLFIFVTTFAVMNVVVAVIVQNTILHASQRNDELSSVQQKRDMAAAVKILEIFELSDTDGDGEVSKEEFVTALKKPQIMKLLHEINIDVRQAETLFDVLDYDGSGVLEGAEFVEGVMSARGEAQAREVLAVQCDLYKDDMQFNDSLHEFALSLKQSLQSCQEGVSAFRKDLRKARAVARSLPSAQKRLAVSSPRLESAETMNGGE